MSPLRYIHYAFTSAGLPAAAAEKHATFAAQALARRFELPLEAIHVVHRPRLPEDAPFQLSCYKGKSETCPQAMAVAAKLVLPYLRDVGVLADWQPGEDLQVDEQALTRLAKGGVKIPEMDERVQWLRSQATSAAVNHDKYARSAHGYFSSGNRTRPALVLPADADIGQVAAALLKHRRDEVAALVSGGAK